MSTGELNEQLKDPEFRRKFERAGVLNQAADMVEDLVLEKGWTQAEFAKQLGVSDAYVSQLLTGDKNLTLGTLSDAMYVLGQKLVLSGAPLSNLDWEDGPQGAEEWMAGGDTECFEVDTSEVWNPAA